MTATSTICTLGIPMDLGQARRGVDMGPSAVRYAGLSARLASLGYRDEALGNIEIRDREVLSSKGGLDFLPAALEACRAMYTAASEATRRGSFPCFWAATTRSPSAPWVA